MKFWMIVLLIALLIFGRFRIVEDQQMKMDARVTAIETKLKETMAAVGQLHQEDVYINEVVNQEQK